MYKEVSLNLRMLHLKKPEMFFSKWREGRPKTKVGFLNVTPRPHSSQKWKLERCCSRYVKDSSLKNICTWSLHEGLGLLKTGTESLWTCFCGSWTRMSTYSLFLIGQDGIQWALNSLALLKLLSHPYFCFSYDYFSCGGKQRKEGWNLEGGGGLMMTLEFPPQ